MLSKIITEFAEVSRYKINSSKLVLLSLNMQREQKVLISRMIGISWKQLVKYLRIKIASLDISILWAWNIEPIIRHVKAVRYLAVPRNFLVRESCSYKNENSTKIYIQTLILQIPLTALRKIQAIFSKFIWDGKKSKTELSSMQQRKAQGGIALPNIVLYYQVLLLEAMLQWWHEENF